MLFGYFTLLVALVIEAVGAYYSITGLAAIFSGAVLPILIMGASLEVGKVTAAVWLKQNWDRASLAYKMYLVPAVAFLMLLTSMGIFGFLSKAHSDQSLVSGDSQAKVAIYDEKIRTAKDNIEANRKALKQMDEAVDQVMARSTDEKGADKAVSIRRNQQKERTKLLAEIDAEQKKIASLNEEVAPLRAEFRKIENEVGPIKYIAALIYGDNPDANILERAVRWVIILIVAVFDPLALVLILAAQQSLRWAREEKEYLVEESVAAVDDASTEDKALIQEEPAIEPEVGTQQTPEESILAKHPYLSMPFDHFPTGKPMVAPAAETSASKKPKAKKTKKEPVETIEPIVESPNAPGLDIGNERPGDYLTPAEVSKFPKVPETAARNKVEIAPVPEALNVRKVSALAADNIEAAPSQSGFGTAFPNGANKGDTFLRVDYLPNKLFKFNGQKWIEVDKSKTDSYTYDEQYILFLIEKLQSGEYDLDQLSASEQELVEEKLKQLSNDKT